MKTNKMGKILIALDYDPTAQKVAEEGFLVAKAMNAEVILLHVISDPEFYTSTKHVTIIGFAGSEETVPVKLDSVDELKKVAHKFLEKSKELLGDKTIKTVLKEGMPAESILTAAKDLHAHLIVMGSHSRRGTKKIVMGRVTKGVLQNTVRPLLIIPTKKNK
jgi:nucleotide-binding universal stress UspA family protein